MFPASSTLGQAPRTKILWFVKSRNDLQIDVVGTTSQQTVSDWVTLGGYKALQITASGLKLDRQVFQLVQAMATYSPSQPGFDAVTASQVPNDTLLQNAIAAAWHA